jgi:hypothetical protein
MRCKYSIYWAIHLYRDNFYIFAFESANRYVYFMSWSVWIWATNTGLHFLIFSFTTLWSFKFVRKSCIKVYEESKILNLEVIFLVLSFGVRCYGSIPHKMNLVLAIWTYHIYISVTESPQKWGVCLPRSYWGILDEARMRKHTQISIQYQIWNSS